MSDSVTSYECPCGRNHPVGVECAIVRHLPACKGTNCGCTDGLNHSPECRAELDALCNEAATLDHINHGGWKCDFCDYNGQDNTQGNFFCARCAIHR